MLAVSNYGHLALKGSFRLAQAINDRLHEQESLADACRFLVELLSLLLRCDAVCLELQTAILPQPFRAPETVFLDLPSCHHEQHIPLTLGGHEVGGIRLLYRNSLGDEPEDLALAEFAINCLELQFHKWVGDFDAHATLSPAELRVFGHLHLPNAEICDALCLSHDTVRSHIKKIYKKLGVTTRQDALKLGAGLPVT